MKTNIYPLVSDDNLQLTKTVRDKVSPEKDSFRLI